jgi:ElaB/YqjD/DUF883 family membrane-anchored ribosome-binding protein
MVALAVLYRVAPDRTAARLAWTSPGAVVATVVWLAVSAGFSLYVTFFASYAKTYGAVAGIVVLLMWLWLTSFAVLFGAEINAESERQTLVDTTVGPDKPIGARGATAADNKNLDAAVPDEDAAEPGDRRGGYAAPATPAARSSETDVTALESGLVTTRARLATNVGALAAKADLKTQVKRRAAETTRRLAARAEDQVRRHPAAVAALAAGTGLVIGLLARRGRRS